jgi:glycogen debranching enzyme
VHVRNLADEAVRCTVEVEVESDFAPLYIVKEGRNERTGHSDAEVVDGAVVNTNRRGRVERGLRVSFSESPARVDRDGAASTACVTTTIGARASWTLCVEMTPSLNGQDVEPLHRCGEPVEESIPAQRLEDWRRDVPTIRTASQSLSEAVDQSIADLAALRIFDPDHPDRVILAAGAPWFMTLFGRDSLLTAWMSLPVSPAIALGVVQTLARFQGSKVDAGSEEEPGRILHELRFEDAASLSLSDSSVYYGTADATPLFVMLLGELRRWGVGREVVDGLLPNVERALEWIEQYGDRDGDGYVEYERKTERGLENQGWKDSWDAVRFADGSLAKAPIAICEVQGYVYSAYLARHSFAAEAGDSQGAERWRRKALDLKAAFNRDFWLPDRGWFAMGLDRDKRPIDALASNMGHCLWTGIVDEDKAAQVAAHLMSDELFSGWGVRTLATNMLGYNPVSYHCGSVWPHDNAIIAAGLMRYGFVEEAHRIVTALIEASSTHGRRLPELFSGLDRSEIPWVVSYPASCIPQAWAAATPLSFLRTLLRFEPCVPHGRAWIAPALPDAVRSLRQRGMELAGASVYNEADDDRVHVDGLPEGIELLTYPRDPSPAA